MGHREDLDVITTKDVDQAQAVSRKCVAPRTACHRPARSGTYGDGINGPLKLLMKAIRRREISRGIAVVHGFDLLRCSRIKPDC